MLCYLTMKMEIENMLKVTSGPNTDRMAESLFKGKSVLFGTQSGPFLARIRSAGIQDGTESDTEVWSLTGTGNFEGDSLRISFSCTYRTNMKDCHLNLTAN